MNRRPPPFRFIAAVMIACACAVPLRAQPTLEYDVKAALLLNFARFIEWPDRAFASPRAAIDICVFAPNPFGQALERVLQGEMVGMRPLSTRDVHRAADAAGCHLLFVPAGTESRAAAILRQISSPTITVGESRRFEDLGGALSFVLEGGRVRFTVNLQSVEERGVRISARMLKLASRVDRAPEK